MLVASVTSPCSPSARTRARARASLSGPVPQGRAADRLARARWPGTHACPMSCGQPPAAVDRATRASSRAGQSPPRAPRARQPRDRRPGRLPGSPGEARAACSNRVAVLLDEPEVVVLERGHHDEVDLLDHPVDALRCIGVLDRILAQAHPAILVDHARTGRADRHVAPRPIAVTTPGYRHAC